MVVMTVVMVVVMVVTGILLALGYRGSIYVKVLGLDFVIAHNFRFPEQVILATFHFVRLGKLRRQGFMKSILNLPVGK